MIRRGGAAVLAAVATLVATACDSGEAARPPDEPPVCEVRFAAPPGFAPLEPFREEYEDRIGLRLGFRDGRDREFHVFSGIPGEFGEGLSDEGSLELTLGRTATLAGRGAVWVALWTEGGSCDPRVVLGSGFTRLGFLRALRDAGLAPPRER